MTGVSNSVYSKRKRFLPEYRKLFAALLDIPDEDVRDRVMNAVNGPQTCSVCKIKIGNLKNIAIQTDKIECITNNTEIIENTEDIASNSPVVVKRRRKRKRNCPKVVKTAQHSSTTPVLTQDNVHPKQVDVQQKPAKVMRTDSEDNCVNDFFQNLLVEGKTLESIAPVQNDDTIERIKEKMKEEWDTCLVVNQVGLLPIHQAIIQNNLAKLKRQIYVWKFRKFNLMDILTEEGDDIIQLAVKENCYKCMIEELLKEDIHLNNTDDDCNSIIHLAITHLTDDPEQQQSLKSFELLLNKIDIKLLLQQNNAGLTALHMAVKEDKFLMAEKILNVIDDRLKLRSVPRLDRSFVDKDIFQQHYCKQCDSFEGREQNELKDKILNAKDMKSGCTALYFAMELRHDHLVYLLMAHMCNPIIKNLAGLDAKSYYTDHGNNASIVGALDKLAEFQNAVLPQDGRVKRSKASID